MTWWANKFELPCTKNFTSKDKDEHEEEIEFNESTRLGIGVPGGKGGRNKTDCKLEASVLGLNSIRSIRLSYRIEAKPPPELAITAVICWRKGTLSNLK